MRKIGEREQEAIREVCNLGAIHGYGNLMSHLASAWARHLMDEFNINEASAMQVPHGTPLPIQMHVDIIERGEWDETGERYRDNHQQV